MKCKLLFFFLDWLTSHSIRWRARGLWSVLQPATRDKQNVLVSVVSALEATDFYHMKTKKKSYRFGMLKIVPYFAPYSWTFFYSLLPDLKNLCFWSTLISPSLSACWAAVRRACSSRDSVRFQDRTSLSRNCPLSEPLSL